MRSAARHRRILSGLALAVYLLGGLAAEFSHNHGCCEHASEDSSAGHACHHHGHGKTAPECAIPERPAVAHIACEHALAHSAERQRVRGEGHAAPAAAIPFGQEPVVTAPCSACEYQAQPMGAIACIVTLSGCQLVVERQFAAVPTFSAIALLAFQARGPPSRG